MNHLYASPVHLCASPSSIRYYKLLPVFTQDPTQHSYNESVGSWYQYLYASPVHLCASPSSIRYYKLLPVDIHSLTSPEYLFTVHHVAANQPDSTQTDCNQRTCVHARSHSTQWRSSEHTALTSWWPLLCLSCFHTCFMWHSFRNPNTTDQNYPIPSISKNILRWAASYIQYVGSKIGCSPTMNPKLPACSNTPPHSSNTAIARMKPEHEPQEPSIGTLKELKGESVENNSQTILGQPRHAPYTIKPN
jgi:hypothetical protein